MLEASLILKKALVLCIRRRGDSETQSSMIRSLKGDQEAKSK